MTHFFSQKSFTIISVQIFFSEINEDTNSEITSNVTVVNNNSSDSYAENEISNDPPLYIEVVKDPPSYAEAIRAEVRIFTICFYKYCMYLQCQTSWKIMNYYGQIYFWVEKPKY